MYYSTTRSELPWFKYYNICYRCRDEISVWRNTQSQIVSDKKVCSITYSLKSHLCAFRNADVPLNNKCFQDLWIDMHHERLILHNEDIYIYIYIYIYIIYSSLRFDHITSLAEGTGTDWLQTRRTVFQYVHGSAPPYLVNELSRPTDSQARCRLRSASSSILVVRRFVDCTTQGYKHYLLSSMRLHGS